MAGTLEAPSGKGAGDENFPVGSWLIRPDLRRHVHALYGFARAADDIADSAILEADDKVARLEGMAAIIRGETAREEARAQSSHALTFRDSLEESGVSVRHGLDLLAAFTQDARKLRYRDWDDLLAYCFLSASPIGRHLLDLHGEGELCRRGADALCNALQVINHLQDFAEDYRRLDRVYLPEQFMEQEGVKTADLGGHHLTLGIRRVMDRVIAPLEGLLHTSADLVVQVRDPRIALECHVIHTLAVRLTGRLKREDPIATRVVMSKQVAGAWSLLAIAQGWTRRRLSLKTTTGGLVAQR